MAKMSNMAGKVLSSSLLTERGVISIILCHDDVLGMAGSSVEDGGVDFSEASQVLLQAGEVGGAHGILYFVRGFSGRRCTLLDKACSHGPPSQAHL